LLVCFSMRTILLVIACAGCVAPGSVEASGSGVTTGLQAQDLECPASGTLDRYLAGGGALGISVRDGNGQSVFGDGSGVTGEINDSQALDGAPGEWRLVVDPEGFAGQFKITLSCL
jgi:hypothetical protein